MWINKTISVLISRYLKNFPFKFVLIIIKVKWKIMKIVSISLLTR